jgi:septal ring factor EnvC (AmiA/AmiB activator)
VKHPWLLATLVVAQAGLAQPLPQPPHLEGAEKKALLDRYAKQLDQELGLLTALDQLDRDSTEMDNQIVKLSVERAQATDALVAAEDARAKAETELAKMRLAVQARLRALARIEALPSLRFALSSSDFAKSIVKDRLLRRLIVDDRARLRDYTKRLTDQEKLTNERDAALNALNQLDLQLHDKKWQGEQERRDKLALIVQIDEDKKTAERLARDLDAASREVAGKVATLKEWQERKYTFAQTQGKLLPPVSGRVEVAFGEVKHPKFGTILMHRGLDYRAAGSQIGAPVRAVFWGRVALVGWLTGYGDTVILDHGRGWHTVYAHLDNIRVQVGEVVPARQRIADIGQSGSLKGRYLYFEIRHNGQPLDPGDWFNHH